MQELLTRLKTVQKLIGYKFTGEKVIMVLCPYSKIIISSCSYALKNGIHW